MDRFDVSDQDQPATREVRIDEIDMEFLADPDTGELFAPPERWVTIMIDAGLYELAEQLRREITWRRHVFRS